MIIKQDPTTSSAANACGNCGLEERRLLHHVRHRGIFRRLCTTCVLRLHPQSFCPTCFQVYPPSTTHDSVITCFKCYSSSHSYCVTAPASPGNNYTCPLCINPNSPIFNLRRETEANVTGGDEGLDVTGNSEVYRVIDRTSAKILLAAAKIAAASMFKAAVAARAEAERKAKEAAFTRKRAKEALDHVAYLVVREKVRKKEAGILISPEVPGPSGGENVAHLGGGGGGDKSGGNVGHLGGGGVRVSRENYTNAKNTIGARSENVNGGVPPVVVMEEKTNLTGNVNRVDNSSQVLAALNAVELRENEQMGGINALDEVSAKLSNDSSVLMDVDNNEAMRVSSGSNDGESLVEKNSVGGNETSANLGSSAEDHNLHEEKIEEVIEGMVLVPQVEDQMQHKENNEGHHNNGTQQ
ncbi:uncharacterized protein LOC111384862 [Olea europaea subsp. europaea]|uniref:Uncharacterized protein LOC111384862 n=1 Tax=Olea europaea subsp. europaea TaxID=158383 RepID=A0A8S0UER4_OLEEU|nr:uncharacterized protein LOC111384862 [Olea europaea subsp. europaea]